MEKHIYGIFYTMLYVILCAMFIGTFVEKRKLPSKWYRYGVIGCMMVIDYIVSVKLDGNIVFERNCNHWIGNIEPNVIDMFYYGFTEVCCKKVFGNVDGSGMGKIYNISDLHNNCFGCTFDKF